MIYSNPSTWASREVGSSSMFRPNPAMTNNQLCPSNMCSCGCSDPASMHYNCSLSTTPAGGVWSPPISSTPTGFVTPNLYNSGTRIACPPSDMVAASAASNLLPQRDFSPFNSDYPHTSVTPEHQQPNIGHHTPARTSSRNSSGMTAFDQNSRAGRPHPRPTGPSLPSWTALSPRRNNGGEHEDNEKHGQS